MRNTRNLYLFLTAALFASGCGNVTHKPAYDNYQFVSRGSVESNSDDSDTPNPSHSSDDNSAYDNYTFVSRGSKELPQNGVDTSRPPSAPEESKAYNNYMFVSRGSVEREEINAKVSNVNGRTGKRVPHSDVPNSVSSDSAYQRFSSITDEEFNVNWGKLRRGLSIDQVARLIGLPPRKHDPQIERLEALLAESGDDRGVNVTHSACSLQHSYCNNFALTERRQVEKLVEHLLDQSNRFREAESFSLTFDRNGELTSWTKKLSK